MTRAEAIAIIAAAARDRAVVCNLGHPSQELFAAADGPNHFYMLGSMGLAGPIGLGLALAAGRPVVVLDGDGSVLMNPGTLITAANTPATDLTWFILDNGTYGSTGDQPTYSRRGRTKLIELARGAGIEAVRVISSRDELRQEAERLMASAGLEVVVVEVEPGAGDLAPIPLDPIEIRNRFQKWLGTYDRTAGPVKDKPR